MDRRKFLKGTGIAAAASTLAAPALAQSQPEIRWRLTSSFPKSLDIVYGMAEQISKAVAEMTDNRFQIQVFAAGEVVGGLQALDAVQNGTVECAHTTCFYYIGKDPTWCIPSGLPFGLNSRQQNAWMLLHGPELLGDFFKASNIVVMPAGNTAAQMGGWFRKELKSVDDLKGLKFRVGGLAGQILARLGVVPQQIAGGDIYPALERGTIDAAEWIGPYDDEKLGLQKVAPYYYYPGWWEGGTQNHLMVNPEKWAALPPAYKAAVQKAAWYASTWSLARFDAGNPPALRKLVAGGAQLKSFPRDILEAAWKESHDLYAEIGAKNKTFKTVSDHYLAFRNEEYLWWQIAEYGYDTFQVRQRVRG